MHETRHSEAILPLGEGLSVARQNDGNRLTLKVRLQSGSDCVLHWGLSRRPGGPWQRPPDAFWPDGTAPADGNAVHTPLAANDKGEREVAIQLDLPCPWKNLPFVLYFPKEKRWLKSGGRDFLIQLPRGHSGLSTPTEALEAWVPDSATDRQDFTLDGGEQLSVATSATGDVVRVYLVCDADPPLLLHWGLVWHFRHEWQLPPEEYRPADTTVFDHQAVRTAFTERDGLRYLQLEFRKPADGPGPKGLKFVIYQPEDNTWLKSGGTDMYVPLFEPTADARVASPRLWDLAERIVGAEKGAMSWTLMHRYNLCHDLLSVAQDDEDALALLFSWLRYSAIRQLDWQRCYNTKPRELSNAQDRLTARLASLWRSKPADRLWTRLMMTTLGRGGDGQRIRDEILHIMHRNNIKESSGHFIEEWHQKLHNNTTPDDVVICQAYLDFLRSNGDRKRFYQTLEAGGVTRERLQSFERPIRSEPDYYGDRKDALVGEFENFLRILKSVHAGTDLETAVGAARSRLDGGLQQHLDGLLALRNRQPSVREMAGAIVSARERLKGALAGAREDGAVRDLLFLDLALEDALRVAIERQNLSQFNRDRLVELVQLALRNLNVSLDSQELAYCASHWAALCGRPRNWRDWALHARSVAERASRWVQEFTSDFYQRLQPKAEFLGTAFEADAWTIPLFSEEVIRGGPAFVLALLLRHLDPILRKEAGLGGWQVISPGRASGRVRVVDRLGDVQAERFAEATVLIADAVAGSEEIPEGVTAVLTRDTPDLVSHVAVRARNAQVLFATCFEPEKYDSLKGLKERSISLQVTPGGDVDYSEAPGEPGASAPGESFESARNFLRGLTPPVRQEITPSRWVVTQDEFTPEIVGAKANNLNGLRGKLPEWIHLPASLALPFGAFEKALENVANRELRGKVEALLAKAEQNPAEVLAQVRALLVEMAAPGPLQAALQEGWQRVGLASIPWEQAWHAIRRVWASKWNERAYLSRRARGVPHDSLRMAVLIQQVIPADYAYVIHTANPLTGSREEIFAEVVLGLGETLVGNYPGRALGFVCRKADQSVELISYPSKGVGLYGKGLIFRSDSNGEDLEGFAGAGLYDSFLAEEPEQRALDYTREKLVWDEGFRNELLRSIARIGLEVERVLGSAQDIEGAVTGGQFYVVQTRPQVGLSGD